MRAELTSILRKGNMSNAQDYSLMLIEAVATLAIVIGVSVAFANTVKGRVKNHEEFSGIGWGLLTGGLFGLGLIPVLIAQSAINRVVDQAKPNKYLKYAKKQMKDFTKVYVTCFLVWVAIGFFPIIGIIGGLIAVPIILYVCLSDKVEYPYPHDDESSEGTNDDDSEMEEGDSDSSVDML